MTSSSVLRRWFPIPKLLAMKGGGLEISERSIKYLEFKNGRLGAWGEEELPEGIIKNGEVVDRKALTDVLTRIRKRAGFSLCYVSLPETRGYLFEITLPPAALSDVIGAVALELPGYVPLPSEEVIFDCEVVQMGERERMAVSAFPEGIAEGYAQALGTAGFIPLSMELEPQAAARAVVPIEKDSRVRSSQSSANDATLIVDFGAQKSLMCIVSNGIPRLTTSFEGTAALDIELARGRSPADIFKVKSEEGLSSQDKELSVLFNKGVESLIQETKRHAVYWNTRGQDDEAPCHIVSAVLYGGNALIRGLPETLSRALNIPVFVADVWKNTPLRAAGIVPSLPKEESLRYATVIGLALRARSHAI